MLFKNENVNIFDLKLEKIIDTGIFKGINQYGHALIEKEREIKAIFDGRMRKL